MAYWAIIGIPILAAALCAGMLVMLLPWLKSYALSQPVDRSLHREPTPQGGGLGVVLATLIAAWLAVAVAGVLPAGALALLSALTGGVALLTLVGLLDDMHGLSPAPRLIAQCLAVGLILLMLPADMRLIPALPLWIERGCILLVGVWFVNLVNFMDGIDWMTVAEAVPITAAIVVLGLAGIVTPLAMLVALALLGAVLGFAPFNRPGGAAVSGRRRQPADRPHPGLAAARFSPPAAISRQRCCFRSTISPMRASRSCCASAAVRPFGRRIAATSISAPSPPG